jgi:hypothetical protein
MQETLCGTAKESMLRAIIPVGTDDETIHTPLLDLPVDFRHRMTGKDHCIVRKWAVKDGITERLQLITCSQFTTG